MPRRRMGFVASALVAALYSILASGAGEHSVVIPAHGASTRGVAASITVKLIERSSSGQSGTATLSTILHGASAKEGTLVRVRVRPPVKFRGRQVILIRKVRCAAYATKIGDAVSRAGPVLATVGLAASGRQYIVSARLATLADGRRSIQVSTMPPLSDRVVACGDIPKAQR